VGERGAERELPYLGDVTQYHGEEFLCQRTLKYNSKLGSFITLKLDNMDVQITMTQDLLRSHERNINVLWEIMGFGRQVLKEGWDLKEGEKLHPGMLSRAQDDFKHNDAFNWCRKK
jgi:hypothetical protein